MKIKEVYETLFLVRGRGLDISPQMEKLLNCTYKRLEKAWELSIMAGLPIISSAMLFCPIFLSATTRESQVGSLLTM